MEKPRVITLGCRLNALESEIMRRHAEEAGLADTVGRVAAGLRAAGLGAGDHVALCSPNRPEFIIVYYAVLTIGGTVVTVSPLSTVPEIAYYPDDSDADALICFAGDDGRLGRRGGKRGHRAGVRLRPHTQVDVSIGSQPAFGVQSSYCPALDQQRPHTSRPK